MSYYLDTVLHWWLLSCLAYLALRVLDWLTAPAKPRPWDFVPLRYSPADMQLANLEAFHDQMLRAGPRPQIVIPTGAWEFRNVPLDKVRSGLLTVNEARAEAGYKPIRGLKTDFISFDEDLSEFGMFLRDYLGNWHKIGQDCA
jgi:hypothetical protein